MHNMFIYIFIFFTSNMLGFAIESKEIVIVILSQANKYHANLANTLKNDVLNQAEKLNIGYPVVHISHIDFYHVGGWTISPLMPKIEAIHGSNSSWVFFVENRTKIRLDKLVQILNKYDKEKEYFIGYALHDKEATIIHHFAFFKEPDSFKYPSISSGFAVSIPLLHRLVKRQISYNLQHDFSIDNSHELSLFIWDNGNGTKLTHEPNFCITIGKDCASFPQIFKKCNRLQSRDGIYFAVKTCQKFHENRVSVVKSTWGKFVKRIKFFSDVQDNEIPTIDLGIPNTESGHCRKTIGIIKYLAQEIIDLPEIEWIVITDDDTILSVSRLQELLSCYDPSTTTALGERYGFDVQGSHGYNYITGGGGMVFSRPLLMKLAIPRICECSSASTPDDMFLGICISRLSVPITHSPNFHQARPNDYADNYLKTHAPISFHKHWMIDPIKVYKTWFSMDDEAKDISHEEL